MNSDLQIKNLFSTEVDALSKSTKQALQRNHPRAKAGQSQLSKESNLSKKQINEIMSFAQGRRSRPPLQKLSSHVSLPVGNRKLKARDSQGSLEVEKRKFIFAPQSKQIQMFISVDTDSKAPEKKESRRKL